MFVDIQKWLVRERSHYVIVLYVQRQVFCKEKAVE